MTALSPGGNRPARLYASRFCEALAHYRIHKQLSMADLSFLCQVPCRTLRDWLNGRRRPGLERIKRMCPNLGWTFERVVSRHSIRLDIKESDTALLDRNYRYLSQLDVDPYLAMREICIAAAEIMAYMIAKGQSVSAHSPSLSESYVVWNEGDPMAGHVLKLIGHRHQGIMVSLFDGKDQVDHWRPLSEETIDDICNARTNQSQPGRPRRCATGNSATTSEASEAHERRRIAQ